MNTSDAGDSLSLDGVVGLFKFYQEAAERTKGHAWAQSTWVLTLSGAILGFSINLFVQHDHAPVVGYMFIVWLSAVAGVLQSAYLVFVLVELGKHIRSDWTMADRFAAQSAVFAACIGLKEAKPGFPKFLIRLMWPAILFAAAHLLWAAYVTVSTS